MLDRAALDGSHAALATGRAARDTQGAQARRFGPELARAGSMLAEARSRPALSAAAKDAAGPGLAVRRELAAAHDRTLSRRRGEFDVGERMDAQPGLAETTPVSVVRGDAPVAPPLPPSIASAVDRIAVELRRREMAEGPSLDLAFGGNARVRIARGDRGIELAVHGNGAHSRLAASELPSIVEALRSRGIAVARAEANGRLIATAPRGAAGEGRSAYRIAR